MTARLQGGGMALAGILATSFSLAWVDAALGTTDAITHLVLIAAVNGLLGLGRFAGQRWASTGPATSAA